MTRYALRDRETRAPVPGEYPSATEAAIAALLKAAPGQRLEFYAVDGPPDTLPPASERTP